MRYLQWALVPVFACFLLPLPPLAAQEGGGDDPAPSAWLKDGDEAFRQAMAEGEAAPGTPEGADSDSGGEVGMSEEGRGFFMDSARAWESKAKDDPARWYDAATAWHMAGRPDLAIRDLRIYLAVDPLSSAAWENLARARQEAGTQDPGGEGIGALPWALWTFLAAAALAGLAVLWAGIWLLVRRQPVLVVAAVLGAAGLLAGGAGLVLEAARPVMGVVMQPVTGRKGDGLLYAPWPARPWKPGQECRILETRDTWVQVQVDQVRSWLPVEALWIPGTAGSP